MKKFWKPFRVIVSLVVLLSITFLFIDFRQLLPSHWYDSITYFQFVPSALKFFHLAGILSAGFLVVLLLTLLFGRVYCSILCPLGIFQDVTSYISRKFRTKKFRFKYAKAHHVWRYVFLGLAVIPILFGSIILTGYLDPYSNFGRIFSGFGKPLYTLSNNLLAAILVKFKIYAIAPFDVARFDWGVIAFPLVVFGVVVWMSATKGRLYCNTICPVGTFLGLLSKVSLFRVKINESTCNQCGKCSFSCKSQCINIKDQTVDNSRCVGCFNCLQACDKNSIGYKFGYARAPKNEPVEADQSKRTFIAGSVVLAVGLFGFTKLVKGAEKPDAKGRIAIKKKNYCTPPGSVNMDRFKDICTACHLCVSACPNNVLQPSMLEYGWSGMLQPFMDYKSGFCNIECTKCTEVCPTGAIKPLTKEEKRSEQIGIAHFVQTNCIVYQDETSCGSCSEHCPTQAVKMVNYKSGLTIPHVTPEICIGCGACEHVCPAKPHKAIYVEGSTVHKVAQKPNNDKIENKQLEEFPF